MGSELVTGKLSVRDASHLLARYLGTEEQNVSYVLIHPGDYFRIVLPPNTTPEQPVYDIMVWVFRIRFPTGIRDLNGLEGYEGVSHLICMDNKHNWHCSCDAQVRGYACQHLRVLGLPADVPHEARIERTNAEFNYDIYAARLGRESIPTSESNHATAHWDEVGIFGAESTETTAINSVNDYVYSIRNPDTDTIYEFQVQDGKVVKQVVKHTRKAKTKKEVKNDPGAKRHIDLEDDVI